MTDAGPQSVTISPPHVPGYVVSELLGAGATGQVWRAHRELLPTGVVADVAIKVVVPGPAADRELAVLRAVRHPHVLALRDAVVLDPGGLALVTDLLDGGTLASVVAARGRLRPGEVVTVAAPLAQALATLHADGVAHGDLAPGNVLFDGDGKPYLADLGTVRVTGEPRRELYGTAGFVDPAVLVGADASPASDVYGLGALAWFALCGEPAPAPACRRALADVVAELDAAHSGNTPLTGARPAVGSELMQVIEQAVDPDPARRPSPGELARRLHEAAVAEPVWRPGRAPSHGGLTHRIRVVAAQEGAVPRHRRPMTRRWWSRRVLVGLATAAAVVAAVLSGIALSAPGGGSSLAAAAVDDGGPAATTAPGGKTLAPADALRVVRDLARLRAAAFADPSHAHAADAAAGSAAQRAEAAALRALADRGLAYRGLTLAPRSAAVIASQAGRASVRVVIDASAYEVVSATGDTITSVEAAPGRRSRLELVATGSGWRVAESAAS